MVSVAEPSSFVAGELLFANKKMEKQIDLNKTLYELTEEHPELTDILFELGFSGIKNPVARNTHGRVMTIPAGAKLLGIDLNKVIETLKQKGFSIR